MELLGAKLDTLNERVAGHAEATNLKLDAIKDRIAPFAGLPDRMTKLEGRVTNIESKDKDRSEKRLQLPTIIFGGVGAAGVILTIATQLH